MIALIRSAAKFVLNAIAVIIVSSGAGYLLLCWPLNSGNLCGQSKKDGRIRSASISWISQMIIIGCSKIYMFQIHVISMPLLLLLLATTGWAVLILPPLCRSARLTSPSNRARARDAERARRLSSRRRQPADNYRPTEEGRRAGALAARTTNRPDHSNVRRLSVTTTTIKLRRPDLHNIELSSWQ